MSRETRHYALGGGLDLTTPPISTAPGRALAGLNYEPILRGYFSQISPASRDAELIASNATLLQTRLDDLAILAAPAPLMTGDDLGIADCGFVASFAIISLLQDVLDLPVRLPAPIADYASALTAHPSIRSEHARYQHALGEWADGKLRG